MPLLTGNALPALHGVPDWIGGEPAADALAGKPVLVHFWSLSCAICHTVADEVAGWAAEYGPRGLAVIGVHQPRVEDDLDVAQVTADARGPMRIAWPCALDNARKLSSRFDNEFIPAYYVFERDHLLVHRQAGARGFDRLHAQIAAVLDGYTFRRSGYRATSGA